jgi:hypothetical protein
MEGSADNQSMIPIQPLLAQWFDRKLSFAVVSYTVKTLAQKLDADR